MTGRRCHDGASRFRGERALGHFRADARRGMEPRGWQFLPSPKVESNTGREAPVVLVHISGLCQAWQTGQEVIGAECSPPEAMAESDVETTSGHHREPQVRSHQTSRDGTIESFIQQCARQRQCGNFGSRSTVCSTEQSLDVGGKAMVSAVNLLCEFAVRPSPTRIAECSEIHPTMGLLGGRLTSISTSTRNR
jgi:hypothetical protein